MSGDPLLCTNTDACHCVNNFVFSVFLFDGVKTRHDIFSKQRLVKVLVAAFVQNVSLCD